VTAQPQWQALSRSCSSLHPALIVDDINAGASIHSIHFASCKHSWGLITKCCMHADLYGKSGIDPAALGAARVASKIGASMLCQDWHTTALSGLRTMMVLAWPADTPAKSLTKCGAPVAHVMHFVHTSHQ